ncbi:MAG: glycosyltransferase [Candidatus Komeilibacteria bacterium]|nr:glycosyltransferase [Candidatus Komeilibacteria bacterium]
MKKLIYIVNGRIPTEKANGYQISKMCQEFASAGLAVELWLPTRKNPITDNLFEFYGLPKNFTCRYLDCPDFIVYKKYLGKFCFWLQALVFLITLAGQKIDRQTIIFSRQPEIVWLFASRGYQTIYEAHKWPQSKAGWHHRLVRRAAKILVLTQKLKELFVQAGFSEEKLAIMPDAVDLEVFNLNLTKEQARIKLALSQNKTILLYTGSLTTMGQDKGLNDILKSLALLKQNNDSLLFVAVGGSDKEIKRYDQLAQELKVEGLVDWQPRTKPAQVAVWQKAADVLLMPFPFSEHYAYYMSPLKMFEYMASGRPIVASNLPSIREALNETNAVLVKPDDPVDLAAGINKLLNSQEIGEKLVQQALKDVDNYTWAKRAAKIVNFIK